MELWEFFIYPGYKFFVRHMFCKYFPQTLACLLFFCSFVVHYVFILMSSNLPFFSFMVYTSRSLKIICQPQGLEHISFGVFKTLYFHDNNMRSISVLIFLEWIHLFLRSFLSE